MLRRVVNSEERRESEGETVAEGGGCGAVTGGADAAASAGAAGAKGKKRGKRSRQGHKGEKSGEVSQRGKPEVGVKTAALV